MAKTLTQNVIVNGKALFAGDDVDDAVAKTLDDKFFAAPEAAEDDKPAKKPAKKAAAKK